MKAILVLGCEGRQDDGFKFCNGVSNTILDLEKINASDNYMTLIKYLDRVANLFINPCCDINIIGNTIYKLYELNYINEKTNNYYIHFYNLHKRCALILQILPKEK